MSAPSVRSGPAARGRPARSTARCSCGRTATCVPATVHVDDDRLACRPAPSGARCGRRSGHRRVPTGPGRRRGARLRDHRPPASPAAASRLTFPGRGPRAAATGIGSLPGTDIAEAQRIVLGELPDLPHLPELPDRGAGRRHDRPQRRRSWWSCRCSSTPGGWQMASRPGRDLRRTADLLERDLDQLSRAGRRLRRPVQDPGGRPVDPRREAGSADRRPDAARPGRGARPDRLAGRGPAPARRRRCRPRLPRATVLLQLDEPSLPTVLAGHVRDRERPERVPARSRRPTPPPACGPSCRPSGAPVVVHCCAPDLPLQVRPRRRGRRRSPSTWICVKDLDPLGEAIDAGPRDCWPASRRPAASTPGRAPTSAEIADRVRTLWHRLEFPRGPAAAPGGGHAGLRARRCLARVRPRGARGLPRRRPAADRGGVGSCAVSPFSVRASGHHDDMIGRLPAQ